MGTLHQNLIISFLSYATANASKNVSSKSAHDSLSYVKYKRQIATHTISLQRR